MPLPLALKFRESLLRVGHDLVNEFDNIVATLTSAGLLIGSDIYYGQARSRGLQSIGTAAYTQVTLSSFDDPYGLTFGSGLRCPVSGLYSVQFGVSFAASAAGTARIAALYVGGSVQEYVTGGGPFAAGGYILGKALDIRCSAGDVLTLYAWQDTGGALNIGSAVAAGAAQNYLNFRWVRP